MPLFGKDESKKDKPFVYFLVITEKETVIFSYVHPLKETDPSIFNKVKRFEITSSSSTVVLSRAVFALRSFRPEDYTSYPLLHYYYFELFSLFSFLF